ncbi:hypothetical protein [Kamptonema formosum]|uniref:hypothetical protein n=1 Tax=Kamptonema formosum TaxID=331992 RepID=UPI000367ED23|nr:hypothetical protein [Oscillatoria sp. PCC 10802]
MKKSRLVIACCLAILTLIGATGYVQGWAGVPAALTSYCEDIGYLPPARNLTEAENRGRCTWYLWTGGNEKFWRQATLKTAGNVDLLKLVDSRQHDERFKLLGAVNDPGCKKATGPDEYGLWLDECRDPHSTGVIGLRKFKNPNFDPAKWDAQKYESDPTVEPPYRVGMSCAVCHVAFNPLNPPADVKAPQWENLVGVLGNQYLEEGKLFGSHLTPEDFAWHVLNTQQPGTSDTSRIGSDGINNPNAINSIFNLGNRPKHEEVMNDGTTKAVNHILKDGADSIGVAEASLRVYVNIGMCGDYWLTLHDAFQGRTPQKPFDMEKARAECEDWRNTEARMANAEAFLKSVQPMYLKDAPGGGAFLTKDQAVLERGKVIFADTCAKCHSSKQPPEEIAAGSEKAKQWYRDSVRNPDFLVGNFLSDDKRYPITEIGTNAARALATNAIEGHLWEQFSSKTYKELPSPGKLELFNPLDPKTPIEFEVPAGGRGYYRTPSLVSIWATAPFFHNNSLGEYTKDPSVEGRVKAYTDAMEKLLWPENRLGPKSIKVTSADSKLTLPDGTEVPVPKGTPVNLIANIDPKALSGELDLSGGPAAVLQQLLKANQSPDLIEDKGHYFGAELSDEDKKALIEFVKTF